MSTSKNSAHGMSLYDFLKHLPSWLSAMLRSKSVRWVGGPMLVILMCAWGYQSYVQTRQTDQPKQIPDMQQVEQRGRENISTQIKEIGDGANVPIINGSAVIHEAPKPVETKPVDQFRQTSKELVDRIASLKAMYGRRMELMKQQEEARGKLDGKAWALSEMVQVQSRFDEGEANDGKAEFLRKTAADDQAYAATMQQTRDSLSQLSSEIQAEQAVCGGLMVELDAQCSEAVSGGDLGSGGLQEIRAELVGLKDMIRRYEEVAAKRDTAAQAECYHRGVVSGSNAYQQLFFDIMYSKDREEAIWSRHGGEERAPAGGYTRLIAERITNPSEQEVANQRTALNQLESEIGSVTESIAMHSATLRGLGRALFASR